MSSMERELILFLVISAETCENERAKTFLGKLEAIYKTLKKQIAKHPGTKRLVTLVFRNSLAFFNSASCRSREATFAARPVFSLTATSNLDSNFFSSSSKVSSLRSCSPLCCTKERIYTPALAVRVKVRRKGQRKCSDLKTTNGHPGNVQKSYLFLQQSLMFHLKCETVFVLFGT